MQVEFNSWDEWENKRREALVSGEVIEYLRDHKRIKGAGITRIFQYIILPVGAAVAYDFYAFPSVLHLASPFQPHSAILIRCQQNKPYYSEDAPPSFTYQSVDFPVDELLKIHQELQSLQMPHVFSHLAYFRGNDGADYEFAYHAPSVYPAAPVASYLRYRWWSDPSPELIPLAEYWKALKLKLDVLLDT